MERRFDAEGRLIVDWDEVSAAARRGGRPTADDVTVLRDGTRVDTPETMREVIADFIARRQRHQAAVVAARSQLRQRRGSTLANGRPVAVAARRRTVLDVQHGR